MINIYKIPRGNICILRSFKGQKIALKIEGSNWQEYAGAFSII
jgi:hypothetical protein